MGASRQQRIMKISATMESTTGRVNKVPCCLRRV